MAQYRNLTSSEIETMIAQGCNAENWDDVKVVEGFDPKRVRETIFSGKIRLGLFEKSHTLEGGVVRHSGITHATLHNCVVGDNVYIGRVANYIANYEICDDSYIENVDVMTVVGKSTFGNGTQVAALNEGGGREVPIYDHLSAQVAYLIALYRHRPVLVKNLCDLINDYAEKNASEMGRVGKHVSIRNCGKIRNVKFGDYTVAEGCAELLNGSVNGNQEAPVRLGVRVMARDFIISSGSEIDEGAMIDRCFVGQACQIGKQYSATDTLFFSNCQGFHGEAASVFAGPFTVTHHKSSLLIAGMFSFMNAGSGSNQSNHMYKLGPIHQGIVERGSKTTSDSYVLWPAKIGAFSLIMGRHTSHPDTTDLPFSYLIENSNETLLVPAANLRSVGTVRDAQKWPKRDRRKDPNKLDQINFNLLSPYTIQKMMNGIEALESLQKLSGEECDRYYYHNTRIKRTSLLKGIKLYDTAIVKFLGNSIIKRLEVTKFKSIDEIRERLKPDLKDGLGEWLDISGLIAPKHLVGDILDRVENNQYKSVDEVLEDFIELHKNYYTLEWTWAAEKIEKRLGKKIDEITVQDIISLVEAWKSAVISLDKTLYEDAKKEFTLTVQTGFGVDGGDLRRQKDFENVRGAFDKNTFVVEVLKHIEVKEALGNELIDRIKNVK